MRIRQITWAVLLSMFLIPSALFAQRKILKNANKNYQVHDYKEAIKKYITYINRNRNAITPQARLADCYRNTNNLKEAEKWYENVVYQQDLDPEFLFQYGLTLKGLGKYEEARKWFLNYAGTNPDKGMEFAASCQFAINKLKSPAAYRINTEFVNTEAADFAPTFFKDEVVFASSRTDYDKGKANDKVNFAFISNRDQNNYLVKPELLHKRFRAGNEGPISYSANGRWVAITKNNFVKGKRQIPSSGLNLNIEIAEALPNGEWEKAKYFLFNGSKFSTAYPSFSADGKTLYFASNRPDGFGGFDIFVTYRVGNTWTTPENLGPTVNTPGNEITPFFEGKDLYFASDWHKGMGGFDVFRAAKTSGTWDRVFHLDTQINTSRDDYGFIYDKNKNIGYLTSNRPGGRGNEDIYRISKASDNLEIIVLDGYSMQPVVGAEIDFSSCGQPTFVTDISGRHVLQVPQGLNCQAIIRKSGYTSSSLNVSQSQLGGAQSLQVLLRRSGTTDPGAGTQPPAAGDFSGRIYDAGTNRSVLSVFIRATNQQTGRIVETFSNSNGEYLLNLEPYSNYLITYSKIGYLDVSTNLNTQNGQGANVLGDLPIRSTGSTVVDKPTGDGGQAYYGSGYSIQVAAFQSSKTSNFNRFKSLGNLGNVYNRYEGNKTKVRVGVFETREEAVAASKKIKARGFKDCFVVSESLEGLGGDVVIADKGQPTTQPTQPTGYSAYKVRLAAYKKPQYFQRSKVEAYGLVEQKIKGPWTIMLLYGYSNLTEAQRAADRARRAGFPQAHVVTDNGVELKKVK